MRTLTWLMRSKAPLLGKMAEFLESTDTVCCKQTNRRPAELLQSSIINNSHDMIIKHILKGTVIIQRHTERADFSECPLSSRTAKEALRARQPSSLHTPSHFSVWLVTPRGNCRETEMLLFPSPNNCNHFLCLISFPLTFSSADTPLSVSFKELHGNWPVTLYMLRVRLKQTMAHISTYRCLLVDECVRNKLNDKSEERLLSENATKLCEILIKLTPGDFPLAVAETCLGEMVEKTKNSSKEKLWYCKVYMISCSTMIR